MTSSRKILRSSLHDRLLQRESREIGRLHQVADWVQHDGCQVTARLISRALTRRTRAVIVNSPSNPTGAVLEPKELLALARLARRRGFTILYDDTYARLAFGGAKPHLQAVRDAAGDRFVVIGTASGRRNETGTTG